MCGRITIGQHKDGRNLGYVVYSYDPYRGDNDVDLRGGKLIKVEGRSEHENQHEVFGRFKKA